jgi:hypothetical protein
MSNRKKKPEASVSRSHLMSIVEQLAESGVKKAIIVHMDQDGNIGVNMTEDTMVMEGIFLMRQAEFMIFETDRDEEDFD